MIGDGPAHFRILLKTFGDSGATGNLVHDAHIAALFMETGLPACFPGLKVTYPF
jgi:hypothetical protein